MRLLLLMALGALAEVPLPVYPDCGASPGVEGCPNDLEEQDWWLMSFVPGVAQDSVRPAELELGAGLGLDRALSRSTGSWEVTVAVLDSGIEWSEARLANKVLLNTGELPLPQDPAGVESVDYDFDGNGLVNLRDYALDPRVQIDAGNDTADHMLDPSDLIYSFSDGTDSDGNGYVDDIAGWDFFGNDNDPFTTFDTGFGHHGSEVLEEVGAEGGDADGTIGVCPNCSLLPVRIGDTFIVDGGRAGMGVGYAVDRGADVLAMAVGGLDNPAIASQAFAYADAQGAFIVAAAGDENSYHRNYPAAMDQALFVHSIRADAADSRGPVYSYMNFFNCNNYGPRVDVVAGSLGCATGAVAMIAGSAGLLQSAALERGDRLAPGELRQLLIQTVDDVWLSEGELEQAGTYPSAEGWDPFYGYGRVDLGQAIFTLLDDGVPPMARLGGPEWFEVLDSSGGDEATVQLWMDAPRSTGFGWELAYGRGWDPRDWTVVDTGDSTQEVRGYGVGVPMSELASDPVPEPARDEGVVERVERVHGPAVTFRLRVEDAEGRRAESRRTVFVYDDPDLVSGFPVRLGGSAESSPVLADLDGDGVFEIVIANSSGAVSALGGDGSQLPGWPVTADPIPELPEHLAAYAYTSGALDDEQPDGFLATVAVGDLDGDGSPEVVAATTGGRVYVWTAQGERLPGFPVESIGRTPDEFDTEHTYDRGFMGAPTLLDIDADGALEILAAGMDSRLYAWSADGSAFAPYPVELCHPDNCGEVGARVITSPAVGDVDGDGDLDIALGGNETLESGRFAVSHLIDARTAQALPGWPAASSGLVAAAAILPTVGTGHPASVALADVDGDGDLELMDPVMLGQPNLLHHDREVARALNYNADGFGPDANTNEPSFVALSNNPAFGDLDGDGVPDPLIGGGGTWSLVGLALHTAIDFQYAIGAWSGATGAAFDAWPRQVEDLQFFLAPAVADLDGDESPEAIYGSGGYILHAWDLKGRSPEGWPKFTGQWIVGSPAVGDIDGDGFLEVVLSTREGWLYAWHTLGPADQAVQWAGLHHDPQNTGNYHTPLPTQAGPEVLGCCKSRQEPAEAWLLGPLLLMLGWRRRGSGPGRS